MDCFTFGVIKPKSILSCKLSVDYLMTFCHFDTVHTSDRQKDRHVAVAYAVLLWRCVTYASRVKNKHHTAA